MAEDGLGQTHHPLDDEVSSGPSLQYAAVEISNSHYRGGIPPTIAISM